MDGEVRFVPLTPDRLGDAESVFADCGAAGKCWCAYWYLSNADFKAGWGEANRRFFRELVRRGPPPGILAYVGREPAGWCGVAPRVRLDRLRRSKSFAPVDDVEAFAVNCFVVVKRFRRKGLMRRLIDAAVEFAAASGAAAVEAYPVERHARTGSGDLYVGTATAFRDAGFHEVARRLPQRPIMRKSLAGRQGS